MPRRQWRLAVGFAPPRDMATSDDLSARDFSPAACVVLKSSPGKVGILTGRIDAGRARPRYEAQFIGDPLPEFVPTLALDLIGAQPVSPRRRRLFQ